MSCHAGIKAITLEHFALVVIIRFRPYQQPYLSIRYRCLDAVVLLVSGHIHPLHRPFTPFCWLSKLYSSCWIAAGGFCRCLCGVTVTGSAPCKLWGNLGVQKRSDCAAATLAAVLHLLHESDCAVSQSESLWRQSPARDSRLLVEDGRG